MQVGLMRSILDSAKIPCEIRNEAIAQAMVGTQFVPEIWVLHDEDYDEAKSVVLEFSRNSA